MPWSKNQVDRFKKGLNEKEKEKWVSIANSALSECLNKGGKKIECEASAIKIANSRVGKKNSKYADVHNQINYVEENGEYQIKTQYRFSPQLSLEETDDYQMVLPIGVFYDSWYGELIFTEAYMEALISNWQNKVMGNREPFIDTLHDRGKANGWIEDLQSREDGLYAKIRWTRAGKEAIEEEYFKYFSADLGLITHLETGEQIWPVLIAVALCNTPVMNNLEKVHLNNNSNNNNVTQSDSSYYIVSQVEKIKQLGVNNMDPQEIIQNSELSDTDKQVVLSALNKKSDVPEKDELEKKLTDKENENSVLKLRIEELSEQNKTFSKKLTDIEEQEHAKEKRNIIETALSDGRILPVNKEKWEKAFDKDPENVKELLDAKQPEVDLTSKGTSSSGAGEEVILTDKEKSLIKQLGLTEEEYRQYTEIEGE